MIMAVRSKEFGLNGSGLLSAAKNLFQIIGQVDWVEKLKEIYAIFLDSLTMVKKADFIQDNKEKILADKESYFNKIERKLPAL